MLETIAFSTYFKVSHTIYGKLNSPHTRPCGIRFGECTEGYIRQCSVCVMSQQHHPVSHSILFMPIANACCPLL